MVRISLRYFLLFLAVFVILSILCITCFADENEEDYIVGLVPVEAAVPGVEVVVDSSENLIESPTQKQLVAVYPQSVVGPVEPSDTNGFKAVILALFGDYDPIVCEYAYTNNQGYVTYVREIQPDYIWMISAAIFTVVLFCFFRLLGGVIKKS